MKKTGTPLSGIIQAIGPVLLNISEEQSSKRSAPSRWSFKEIIGHLIDSAANNHQRFVRAAFQEDLVFPGYEQNDWVGIQHYQDRPWVDLVELFTSCNLHIAHVLNVLSPEVLDRERRVHNLHEIAFHPVSASKPATLRYLTIDYIHHLEHHLGNYLPDYQKTL